VEKTDDVEIASLNASIEDLKKQMQTKDDTIYIHEQQMGEI
jgi:hypothetical protein